MPGAWLSPSQDELIAVYRQRYRMALEERKFDAALIFLNKIIEVDPNNLEAKLSKADIYHYHLNDLGRAVEQYRKVIRLSDRDGDCRSRAEDSLSEIMELLS
jgi:tetratricopeptide (TPR) repeat protein